MIPGKSIITSVIFTTVLIVTLSAFSFADQSADEKISAEDVKKEAMETIQSIGKYSSEQRQEAISKIRNVMETLDGQIDQLQDEFEERWDKMDRSYRDQVNKTLSTLRKKRNELSEWYGGIEHSSSDAWSQVKEGFIKSYEAFAKAFEKAESEFNDKRSEKD